MTTTYSPVALADALPGDEVWQAGEWVPVAAFHVFGSRRDLVKIVFPGGGSHAMPVSHCPTIRRAIPGDNSPAAISSELDAANPWDEIAAIQRANAATVQATADTVREGLDAIRNANRGNK